jgi:hypothetical protein
MDPYEYDPIDLGEPAIRLVRLYPGSDSTQISCELFQAWLHQEDEIIPYEALSYTWGSGEAPEHIIVNGQILAVTTNLHRALQQLRLNDQDRILWVDAICINQNNKSERGHQVQQMGDIFRQADRVLFWLGESTPMIDTLMDTLNMLGQLSLSYPCRKWSLDDERWEVIWTSAVRVRLGNATPQQINMLQQGYQNLLHRSWFRRVWILQEVTNARAALVCCGTKTARPWLLNVAQRLLNVRPDDHCQAILDVVPGPWRESSWWSENQDLYTLLTNFGGSQATEPHDLIYALRGMSSDAKISPSLYPDYTKPEQQLVRDTILFIYPLDNQDLIELILPKTIRQLIQSMKSLCNHICMDIVEKLDKKGQEVLLNHTSAEMRNQMLLASLCSDRVGDMVALYFQRWGAMDKVNNSYLIAAAENVHGVKVFETILGLVDDKAELTAEVLMSAATNKGYGDRMLELALQHLNYQLPINPKVMNAAVRNTSCGHEIIKVILKYTNSQLPITLDMMRMLAKNEDRGCEIMELIFRDERNQALLTETMIEFLSYQGDTGIKMMESIGRAAGDDDELTTWLLLKGFKCEKMSEWLTESLLVHRKKPTDTALIAKRAVSHFKNSGELVKLLFRHWGKQEIAITDELLWAAIRNEKSGDSVLAFLFAQMPYETKISQSIINFVLLSENTKMLRICIQYYPSRFAIPAYLQPTIATLGDGPSGLDAVALQLKQQIRAPITPIDFLIIVRYINMIGMRRFLQTYKTQQLVVTTAVVSEMLTNVNRDEVMSEILCGNHQNIRVDTDVALKIIKTFGFPCTEYVISYQHGHFFHDERVRNQIFPQDTSGADGTVASMLLYALMSGYEQTAQLMLECGINAETRFDVYNKYLADSQSTIPKERHRVVERLISHDAEFEWKSKLCDTSLMWAIRRESPRVSALLKYGADVNAVNCMGQSPLMLAVFLRNYSTVKLLLKYRVDTALRDQFGRTAKDWATIRGHQEIVQLLSE